MSEAGVCTCVSLCVCVDVGTSASKRERRRVEFAASVIARALSCTPERRVNSICPADARALCRRRFLPLFAMGFDFPGKSRGRRDTSHLFRRRSQLIDCPLHT